MAPASPDQRRPHPGRPHPLPVQRVLVRHPARVHRVRAVGQLPDERRLLCHLVESEAHLHVLRASLLRLPLRKLLLRQSGQVRTVLLCQELLLGKSDQARADSCDRLWALFRTLCPTRPVL